MNEERRTRAAAIAAYVAKARADNDWETRFAGLPLEQMHKIIMDPTNTSLYEVYINAKNDFAIALLREAVARLPDDIRFDLKFMQAAVALYDYENPNEPLPAAMLIALALGEELPANAERRELAKDAEAHMQARVWGIGDDIQN